MGYPSPVVDERTGAGDPVLNADVVLLVGTAVAVATACVVDYCNDMTWLNVTLASRRTFASVVAVEDVVDAMDTDAAVLDPATGVLYLSAYSFS